MSSPCQLGTGQAATPSHPTTIWGSASVPMMEALPAPLGPPSQMPVGAFFLRPQQIRPGPPHPWTEPSGRGERIAVRRSRIESIPRTPHPGVRMGKESLPAPQRIKPGSPPRSESGGRGEARRSKPAERPALLAPTRTRRKRATSPTLDRGGEAGAASDPDKVAQKTPSPALRAASRVLAGGGAPRPGGYGAPSSPGSPRPVFRTAVPAAAAAAQGWRCGAERGGAASVASASEPSGAPPGGKEAGRGRPRSCRRPPLRGGRGLIPPPLTRWHRRRGRERARGAAVSPGCPRLGPRRLPPRPPARLPACLLLLIGAGFWIERSFCCSYSTFARRLRLAWHHGAAGPGRERCCLLGRRAKKEGRRGLTRVGGQ